MANSLRFRRIGFSLFAISTFLSTSVGAKEFLSNQYGFQLSTPAGYREQHVDGLNIIAEFIEPQSEVGSSAITIEIGHTGSNYSPADKAASSNLPSQKSSKTSVETRRWKDLDLQVVRQEVAASSSDSSVSYLIVFPLSDEGISVVVRGQKSRDKDVLRTFDSCIRHFTNLKPYVAVTANGERAEATHPVEKVLASVLPPVVIGAIVLFWIVKIRRSRSKRESPQPLS